jgi:hypothetical protein
MFHEKILKDSLKNNQLSETLESAVPTKVGVGIDYFVTDIFL